MALAALILGEDPSSLQLAGVLLVLCALLAATPGARVLAEKVLRFRADHRRRTGPVLGADVTVGAANDDNG